VLERNAAFGGPAPKLDRIEFTPFPSREAALEALLVGRVDGLSGLSTRERDLLAASDRLEVRELPELNKSSLLLMNTRNGAFRDKRVRQAVSAAIDRAALIRDVLDGAAEPARGPISPLSWAYDPSIEQNRSGPAEAEALLDQAGWARPAAGQTRRHEADLLTAALLTSDSPARVGEAEAVAEQLRQVGFRVDVRALPLETLRDAYLETGSFDLALLGRWLPESDPDQFALWHSTQVREGGSNFGAISSPELDRWLELGRRQWLEPQRLEAYRGFQAAWAEEQPAALLYHPHAVYALSREILAPAADALPDASWRLRRLPEWERRSGWELSDWLRPARR
jgi:peptide/nickel transport system substrate-binding protein